MEKHLETISQADLIFIDATHDGALEERLIQNFEKAALKRTYLLFDDIRVWTMLRMWRDLRIPKLDLTSFGHWSGTGLARL